MELLKLFLFYQCSLCFSNLIETDDLQKHFSLNSENNDLTNSKGILARGLLDGNFESIFESMLDDKNDKLPLNKLLQQPPELEILPVQQKRLGAYNNENNEVEEQQTTINDRTTFNAARSYGMVFSRPFMPYFRLEIKTGDTIEQDLSFSTLVPLRPNLEILNAIFSAALQQYLRFPRQSNPYNVLIDYNMYKECDTIVGALNIPNGAIHSWKVRVTRRRGRVIYDGECVTPNRRVRLRHGTTISIYYS